MCIFIKYIQGSRFIDISLDNHRISEISENQILQTNRKHENSYLLMRPNAVVEVIDVNVR